MALLSNFISLAKGQIDRGIYVWDLNGVRLKNLTEATIKAKEKDIENEETAIKMWKARKDKYPDAIAADCSGFVVWCLIQCGAKKSGYDKTANGFYKDECMDINKKELRNGDLCFKIGTRDGVKKIVHVGIYCDGKVIEDRGRKWGIVSRSLSLGGWDKYGRLRINWEDNPKKYVLTRLLKKGCKGSDVKELQTALLNKGYSLPKYGADSSFGSETKTAVERLQKDFGLKQDGIVGQQTCEIALGWIWGKAKSVDDTKFIPPNLI